ncbi:hypothetical protein KJ652_04110 [Patescibacteria group bacterium]|nr:hypothetical protein [Patescibacteria group bacterium]MBU1123750.1 hypothetical protein [Patescibacteria group bacterium]MBU1910827.1 hypothetical protein [Patescibacteria group bacterium]
MPIPKRYSSINFVPPPIVSDYATEGLRLRRKFKRGGTSIGIARARDLKNRKRLSPKTIKRMVSFFARHEVDKRGKNFGNPDKPSNGFIAWMLWGGDPAKKWAKSILMEIKQCDLQFPSSK